MGASEDSRQTSTLVDLERAVLADVDRARAAGAALLRWWRHTDETGTYPSRFPLVRTFNLPDKSFAFFGQAPLSDGPLPVMGIMENMLYDQLRGVNIEHMRDELRHFVLHYFMRISAFERPEAYVAAGRFSPPGFLGKLSWCPKYEAQKGGFGFSQLFFKKRDSQQIGRFPEDQQAHIVDLRQIGTKYEWIVAKVRIYDFNISFRPRGQESLQFVLPLKEESYLVVSPEFLVNEDNPEPGILGRYGFGYAFMRPAGSTSPIAYGPGQFIASFQLIHFQVLDNGRIELRLIFVANRPEQILDVPIAPLDWGRRMADFMTLGMASRLAGPVQSALERAPLRLGSFDPVTTFVRLANFLTAGQAAQKYCISMNQLERQFLVQHFMQHYQMVTGSLLTWRQHASWLERAKLPEKLIQGVRT
jgi:hypothetical protein